MDLNLHAWWWSCVVERSDALFRTFFFSPSPDPLVSGLSTQSSWRLMINSEIRKSCLKSPLPLRIVGCRVQSHCMCKVSIFISLLVHSLGSRSEWVSCILAVLLSLTDPVGIKKKEVVWRVFFDGCKMLKRICHELFRFHNYSVFTLIWLHLLFGNHVM